VNFTIIDAPQRSPEWFLARCGRLTGSVAKAMLSTIQKGESAARRDLRIKLVVERLTGKPEEDGYVNDVMQRGIDCEPLAFAAYEGLTGNIAQRTGFLAHTDLMVGCSLDGHVDEFVGIVELKCPKSATHWGYLRGQSIAEHMPQITHNLWVTGAAWCDFLSFDDRFPASMQTFLKRVHRADVDIDAYEKSALAFLDEVEREVTAAKGWSVLSA
jgi:hypothetical protein